MTRFKTRRQKLKTRFDEDGSEVVRGFIKPEIRERFCREAKNRENYTAVNEEFTGNSKAQYGTFDELHDIVKPLVEEKTSLELLKTYNFFRIYMNGSYLPRHTDREACEISVTVNLGGDDWNIGIKDYKGNDHEELLKPGDALIYRGHDLQHWRPGTFEGEELVQAFFHFVDKNGCRTHCENDKFQRDDDGIIKELNNDF